MTQIFVNKMGGVDNMYNFFTKNILLSSCHYMKETILISVKNKFFFISLVYRWFSVRNLNQVSQILDSRTYFNIAQQQTGFRIRIHFLRIRIWVQGFEKVCESGSGYGSGSKAWIFKVEKLFGKYHALFSSIFTNINKSKFFSKVSVFSLKK